MNILLETSGGLVTYFRDAMERAKNCFTDFSIIDAVDILLLGVLFFFLFRFLNNRKSFFILIGLAACYLISMVMTLCGLSGGAYIFSGMIRNGFLVFLILFQPEMRELLERLGMLPMNGFRRIGDQKMRKTLYYKAIDNICTAVESLSASKTGALIVLARSARLDEIIQSGITIDADVNSFLLRNLFFNKAPLHDGAVVIRDARIEAAGCLLPLTRRNDVDSDLGTRHRAAIGMSEVSDAIVIVVSEETGIVSVAYDCALSRGYSQESLRRLLQKKLIHRSDKPTTSVENMFDE